MQTVGKNNEELISCSCTYNLMSHDFNNYGSCEYIDLC